jgi:flagella basal body P-ring formation protein FlgA
MKVLSSVIAIVTALVLSTGAYAQTAITGASSIRLQGRAEAVVTEPMIRLADVAQIDSARVQDDESIIMLKQIVIGASPRAGDKVLVDGTEVLRRLRDEGVRLDSIRYSFPRQIAVTRAFREVTTQELELALTKFLDTSGRQVEVRQLLVDKPVRISTDSFGVEVVSLRSTNPGHFGVDLRSVSGSEEARFQMRLIADEWRLMPVATRPLRKGEIISGQDVELMRVNGTGVGRDTIENISDVVGQSLTRDVGQGEMFRNSAVTVTPLIKAGSRVTIVFRQGRLEATATGVALEGGAARQEIKVRNESSGKIIAGRVADVGIVEVGE